MRASGVPRDLVCSPRGGGQEKQFVLVIMCFRSILCVASLPASHCRGAVKVQAVLDRVVPLRRLTVSVSMQQGVSSPCPGQTVQV